MILEKSYIYMKIKDFLLCETPAEWTGAAARNLPLLLIDHANCEKKAASTALNLMYRYVDDPGLLMRLSKLAREELRHFEQVLGQMSARGIEYRHLTPARYVGELRRLVRTWEPGRLVDLLIVSAIIEARSCERFNALTGVLDAELAGFYASLMRSESRHFAIYLDFAERIGSDVGPRLEAFLSLEQTLIEAEDPEFRFHSGTPAVTDAS